MREPSLCVIFNNVDDTSGIGKLCAWSVRVALDAGFRVTVVARDLAEELRGEVEWLPLYVPPRLHAVQWYAAKATVRQAIRARHWDIVHVSQPQLADIANVLQLHYLVEAARQRAPANGTQTAKSKLGVAQTRLTEVGEARSLRRLRPDLTLMPVTDFLADEFRRLYGTHARTTVVRSPPPRGLRRPTESERKAARQRLAPGASGTVIGFLGGADPRKGGRELLDALAGAPGVRVLFGGSGLPDHPLAQDKSRVLAAGYVEDLQQFLWACDALAVPSSWDPMPTTALEAVATATPVIGSPRSGTVLDLAAHHAALLWTPSEPLAPVLSVLQTTREAIREAGTRYLDTYSEQAQQSALLRVYELCQTRNQP